MHRTTYQAIDVDGFSAFYHGVPIDFLARDFGERLDQRLYFSSVGTGSGRFAPDAASQIPPNR